MTERAPCATKAGRWWARSSARLNSGLRREGRRGDVQPCHPRGRHAELVSASSNPAPAEAWGRWASPPLRASAISARRSSSDDLARRRRDAEREDCDGLPRRQGCGDGKDIPPRDWIPVFAGKVEGVMSNLAIPAHRHAELVSASSNPGPAEAWGSRASPPPRASAISARRSSSDDLARRRRDAEREDRTGLPCRQGCGDGKDIPPRDWIPAFAGKDVRARRCPAIPAHRHAELVSASSDSAQLEARGGWALLPLRASAISARTSSSYRWAQELDFAELRPLPRRPILPSHKGPLSRS